MTNKHEERSHAPLPPSASSRWLTCVASQGYIKRLIADKTIKKRESGPAAERGTRIHEMGEQLLKWALQGKKGEAAYKKADQDELAEAKTYVEYCLRKIDEIDIIYGSPTSGVEDRGVLKADVCWGSRDFWIHAGKHLCVVDLKSGREPVEIKDNTQLAIYAADLVERLKPDTIELCVWQPNSDDGLSPERRYTYTSKQYAALLAKIKVGVAEAEKWLNRKKGHEQALTAGDHCEYCDALGVCATARSRASEISSAKFAPVPVERMDPPPPAKMEPDMVGEILRRAPMFEAWLDAVKLRAVELVTKGKPIPGHKVVHKLTRRAWEKKYTDAQIAKKLGINIKELTETKRLSPSKVEKLLDAAGKRKLDALVFKPVGDPVIVPDSDRRAPLLATKINFKPVSREEEID